MRHLLARLTAGAAIVLGVAFSSLTAADAQSVMKICGDQWKAAKAARTTNGETWPQFLAQCRAHQSSGGAAPAAPKMSDVAERVKKIVVEHLGVNPNKVVDSAKFVDDLGADSLDTVELVMAFEEAFGVEIPDNQAGTLVTVGDVVKFLEKASANK